MSNKIKVLVVGARGAFGGAVLADLQHRAEFELSAMVRGRPGTLGDGVRVVSGDAADRDDLLRATEGIDVLVYGVNFPYQEWGRRLIPAVSVLADVAAERKLRVVFPGNVYGLDPDLPEAQSEDALTKPVTEKGRLRVKAEELLTRSVQRGARLLVIRAGDFFGPNAPQTWFSHMTKESVSGASLQNPQSRPVVHAWAYLPDLAATVRALLLKEGQLDDCEFFHFRGHEASAGEMLERCRVALSSPKRKIRTMPWALIRVLGWFVRFFRELSEMKYLWDKPLLLDQRKLQDFLGRVPHTPLDEAVVASLSVGSTRAAAAVRQRVESPA